MFYLNGIYVGQSPWGVQGAPEKLQGNITETPGWQLTGCFLEQV